MVVLDTLEYKTAFLQHYLKHNYTQTVGSGVVTQGLVVVKLFLTVLCSLSGQHALIARLQTVITNMWSSYEQAILQ